MSDPLIKRGRVKSTVGVEVDELEVSLFCNSDTVVSTPLGNVALAAFARGGGFDGSRLTVVRNYSNAPGQASCGSLHVFGGRVGPITISGTEVRMSVKSDLELLDIMMPRNVYTAQCQHTLFDAGCNLSAAAYAVTGNTTSGSSASSVHSNLAQASGYFDLGVMQYTSGTNNQVARSVRSYANGVVTPVVPFPAVPSTGDLFTIRPGCDKQQTTCDTKFSNMLNFGGFPFIPNPEAVY